MQLTPVADCHERLSRVGVIDVGSNSVRLVVFDGATRSPAYFFNEKILCGLGRGLQETGKLNPLGRERAIAAIDRFAALARTMDMQSLTLVATAAVRDAADGPAFCEEVASRTGLVLKVASGDEEARLSAQGVLLGWPDADGLVCDMGGASLEVAEVSAGRVGNVESTPFAPLRFAADSGSDIGREIQGLRTRFPDSYERLFLVGGSFRAIARIDMEFRSYPLKVLHEYRMPPPDIRATLDWIRTAGQTGLREISGMSVERLELLPAAARVLAALVREFAPSEIAVSSYGIREGLLYENMPEELRGRDPLIEACLAMEAGAARFPGFGRKLSQWLRPLFAGRDAQCMRLVEAACLLHDVTWRAHPDYRAEVCFDNATRANLGGLDHAGRIFIGMALLHRYKNSAGPSRYLPLAELITPEERRDAEVLGRALRLGAILGGADTGGMGSIRTDRHFVELVLVPGHARLYGETVQRRLDALARALGKAARVVF